MTTKKKTRRKPRKMSDKEAHDNAINVIPLLLALGVTDKRPDVDAEGYEVMPVFFEMANQLGQDLTAKERRLVEDRMCVLINLVESWKK